MRKTTVVLAIAVSIVAMLFFLGDQSWAQSVPDERYGVITHYPLAGNPEYFLDGLGVTWYHDRSSDVSGVPQAYGKLAHIFQLDPDPATGNLMTTEEIASLVESRPAGSYWSIGSEPNWGGRSLPGDYAVAYQHYYTNIKAIDPEAKIAAPSILNWDYTCSQSGDCDYTPGVLWMNEFLGAYQNITGELPPVDVWTIDVYPIDFRNIPNNDPNRLVNYGGDQVLHSTVATSQIEKFRAFLDANGYADTPMWITNITAHVGFNGWIFDTSLPGTPIVPSPFATFYWDFMSDYIHSVLDWLELRADSKRIERWFFSITWTDIFTPIDGYMGITFFDGPEDGAALNCLGETYRARALGEPRVSCDREGNTVVEPGPPSVPVAQWWGLAAIAVALAVMSAQHLQRRRLPT
jgi:hypothetical protein